MSNIGLDGFIRPWVVTDKAYCTVSHHGCGQGWRHRSAGDRNGLRHNWSFVGRLACLHRWALPHFDLVWWFVVCLVMGWCRFSGVAIPTAGCVGFLAGSKALVFPVWLGLRADIRFDPWRISGKPTLRRVESSLHWHLSCWRKPDRPCGRNGRYLGWLLSPSCRKSSRTVPASLYCHRVVWIPDCQFG